MNTFKERKSKRQGRERKWKERDAEKKEKVG